MRWRRYVTWFDDERLVGDIVRQMCAGIDGANCVIVFITKTYEEKVQQAVGERDSA